MSIYCVRDGGLPCDLASNAGYGHFCRWVDDLPDTYTQLKRLRKTGEANGRELRLELQDAISGDVPEDIEDVARILLYYSDCDTVGITDGCG